MQVDRNFFSTSTAMCLCAPLLLAACGDDPERLEEVGPSQDEVGPDSDPRCDRLVGETTLQARHVTGDYQTATYSFEYATVTDDGQVKNDWDVLFSDGMFTANTVTDDRSFIVDLGDLAFEKVPETIDLSAHERGPFGEHDDRVVVLDHLYVVRTLDNNTRQYVAMRVAEHPVSETVTIQWRRSGAPDRMIAVPDACLPPGS